MPPDTLAVATIHVYRVPAEPERKLDVAVAATGEGDVEVKNRVSTSIRAAAARPVFNVA